MGIKQGKASHVRLRSWSSILGTEELWKDCEPGCGAMRTVFLEHGVEGRLLEGDQAEVMTMAAVKE